MRRRSVANGLRDETLRLDARSSPATRVDLALALGRRDLALLAAQAGIEVAHARRAIERRRQSRRRASGALAALLA
jgi:hypothetical protein